MDDMQECPPRFGEVCFRFDSVDSTNTVAFEKAAAGAPEGAVVVADTQTAGRGRLKSDWVSVAGRGLFASVILRPRLEVDELTLVPLVSGLAAAKAVRQATGLDARLKWPNDVHVEGRKVSGLLTESRLEPDSKDMVVVVGIGVNLDYPRDVWKGKGLEWAGSLGDFGATVTRDEMLDAFLAILEKDYRRLLADDKEALIREMEEISAMLGREVVLKTKTGLLRGTALRIEPNGSLAVKTESGEVRLLHNADVELIGKPPEE